MAESIHFPACSPRLFPTCGWPLGTHKPGKGVDLAKAVVYLNYNLNDSGLAAYPISLFNSQAFPFT